MSEAFDRLERRAASFLMGLPAQTQILLSGRATVVRDGLTLHPELQLLIALRALTGGKAFRELPPVETRRRFRSEILRHSARVEAVGEVHELSIPLDRRILEARQYRPVGATGSPLPLLLYFHGGGFMVGDLDTHDSLCRLLCSNAGIVVVAVEYRLAPEHPFPAALEDAQGALQWAREAATQLGIDRDRILVGGDSAGGNLSALLCQLSVQEGPPPFAQLLLYPAIDRTTPFPSLEIFGDGFLLARADIDFFQRHYEGAGSGGRRVSPMPCDDLSGQPPALVVTAGFDPLRDEGEAYAAALTRAGVKATVKRFDGLVHGFANLTGVSPACREAVIEIARGLRTLAGLTGETR